MTWATLILALVGPIVVRAIVALAFTVVTFTGVTALVAGMVTLAQNSWSAMPVAVLQLCTLSGIPEVMGLIFGAYAARVAMWAAVGASRYVVKSA
jgi:hypothetical protein